MQHTMKLFSFFFIVLFISFASSTFAQATNTAAEKPHDNGGEITFSLPDFTMQLLINEPHVDPKPFQLPLMFTTSMHLSSYIKSILETDARFDSALKTALDTEPSIDKNAATTFPNSTVIKADFVGEVHFDSDNGLGQIMTQTKVNEMVNQAFKGSVLQDLWQNFQQDATLQQVSNLKVWVIINDINEVDVDTSRGTTQPNDSNNKNAPLKIAAIVIVMVLVSMFSVGSFAYLRHLRARKNANGVNSKDSSSTEESLEFDDPSVFSTEYWKDAWAQAATQAKPRPPRRHRQFKRQPSSVRPNLDSIVEEEEEEEEEDDWDESSWAIEDALDSVNVNGLEDNADSDEEEASALSPNMLDLDMDGQVSCSSQSSTGSFFRDEDPEIMAVLDQKQSGCFPGRGRHRDLEMQVVTTPTTRPTKSSLRTMQRMDSDEITLARNKVLAKRETVQVAKPTVAEELEAVRKRVLLKEKQEKKEVPAVETNELTMVHQRILARKEAETKEPEVVTDELTMMRNRILSKSQHGKESRNDEII